MVDVIESTNQKQIYTKGLKNPIKVSGLHPTKKIDNERRFNDEKNVGYFHLDSMNMKNATKDKLEVEILIHSDIDKENKFIKVYSTKDEDLTSEKIPCNTAMMLVVTS